MWNTVFGVTKEGKKAHRYILVNNKGMSVELSDFGALVLSIYVLDKYGRNLTECAKQDKIDPVIGRKKEIQKSENHACKINTEH